MQSAVKDPVLQQALTPNFSVGCKRILASDEYYPALAADNVTLVASGLKQVRRRQGMAYICSKT
jgi:cation diffusion facilitator CzcD-associated flavoprotein CzcO